MVRKNLIIGVAILILFVSANLVNGIENKKIVGKIVGEDGVKVHLIAFEKAYEVLGAEWIFGDGEKNMLERVFDVLQQVQRARVSKSEFPRPILGLDNQENLKMAEDYLEDVLRFSSGYEKRIILFVLYSMVFPDSFGGIAAAEDLRSLFVLEDIKGYTGDGLIPIFQDGKAIVFITIAGMSADKAGLQSGDEILKINDVSFDNIVDEDDFNKRLEAVHNLYFKEGNKIRYEILSEGQQKVAITEIIKIEEAPLGISSSSEVKSYKHGSIGIIQIFKFDLGVAEQFMTELSELKKQNIEGLVINLKNNPGGLLKEVFQIVKTLTGKGFILKTKNGDRIFGDEISKPFFDGPIAVLINKKSASAAEILAACLQENGAAVIGEKSFGKNCGQRIYVLPNHIFLVYTTFLVYTLSGKTWVGGIRPDIFCETYETWTRAKEYLNKKIKK